MLYTKEDLLSELNRHAADQSFRAISMRQLSDWIDENLIPKGKQTGKGRGLGTSWAYDDTALEAGRRILNLKAQKTNRASLLRIYLWIDGFHHSSHDILAALKSEYRRQSNAFLRMPGWKFDHRFSRHGPVEQDFRSIPKTARVDPRIAHWSSGVPKEDMLLAGSYMTWGEGDVAPKFEIPWMREFAKSFAGAFGDPDSISQPTISLLDEADECDLENGKYEYTTFCC